jgi:hypothetical protein
MATRLTSPWPMPVHVAPKDETVDLLVLITVDGWSEVEMEPALPGLRHHPLTVPGDLRTTPRRADRGLQTLIPDQRPAQRFAPEVPDLPRTGARKLSQESAAVKILVARLDHAELVAVGVGEHHMTLLRTLADVDVPGAELKRPCHRPLLVLQGRTRQMEVPLVQAGPLLLSRKKPEPEPGVIARQERNDIVRLAGHLPPEHAAPETRQTKRVVRIEANCQELTRHPAPHLRACPLKTADRANPPRPQSER